MLQRSLIAGAIALAVTSAAIDAAQARPHPGVRYCGRALAWGWNGRVAACQPRAVSPSRTSIYSKRRAALAVRLERRHHHGAGAGFSLRAALAKPRRWCGWFARQLVGQDPGPRFNLARNWAQWGRPAAPGPGVVVVWPHHIGMITGRTADGQWIVKSGNDGHAVRERPRSLAGAIAFRAG